MIIFGSTLSPFVRKTAAFLREKGLDFRCAVAPGVPEGVSA